MKIGIVGYGNIGKQAENVAKNISDIQLIAVFSRRKDIEINSNAKIEHFDNIFNYKEAIDILLLCGGSATDLPRQMPLIAPHFCFVDSFDNHSKISEYFSVADRQLKLGNNVGIISAGWDPGLFSIQRVINQAILPDCYTQTFWGKGVSQGHSDAIRRINGVKYAVEYTIPNNQILNKVRNGEQPVLNIYDKHIRQCYVVANDNANKQEIKHLIINMPDYFAGYNTTVEFISEQDYLTNHTLMQHAGAVLLNKTSTNGHKYQIEYSLNLDSNPEFTAYVLLAYARAAYRFKKEGVIGAKTVFDIPPSYLSALSQTDLIKEYL